MSTTFRPHPNNVSTALAGNYTAGSGSLVLAPGTGAAFGSVFPLTVTAITAATYGTPGEVLTIFNVTGRTTDTLTGVSATEGTADRAFASGDRVECRWTSGLAAAVETAVNVAGKHGRLHDWRPDRSRATNNFIIYFRLTARRVRFATSGSRRRVYCAGSCARPTRRRLAPTRAPISSLIALADNGSLLYVPIGIARTTGIINCIGVSASASLAGPGSGIIGLNASNLATGTAAPSRLGSGTTQGNTVLNGDNTWRPNFTYVGRTANGTIGVTERWTVIDATSGVVNLTMPPADNTTYGMEFIIWRVDGSANAASINRQGTNQFLPGNVNFININGAGKYVRVISNGGGFWFVVGQN